MAALVARQCVAAVPMTFAQVSTIEGVPILKKIEELRSLDKQVCLSVDESSQLGRLPETMGIVNSVMDFALQHNVQFAMPEIRPPSRDAIDDFRFMFGKPEIANTRWSTMYIATCPFLPAEDDSELAGRCPINETLVYQNTVYLQPREGPPCNAYVMVSSLIDGVYDYSRTSPVLAELYRSRQSALGKWSPSSDLQFPVALAMHIRVESLDAKGVHWIKFEQIPRAFASLIDPKCLKIELHTNADKTHTAVLGLATAWHGAYVNAVDILDNSTKETNAFDGMASASILIGGPSGFSRLAGAVGRAMVKVFVDDPDDESTHPIKALGGVMTFSHDELNHDAVMLALAENTNMTKIVEACNVWLGK